MARLWVVLATLGLGLAASRRSSQDGSWPRLLVLVRKDSGRRPIFLWDPASNDSPTTVAKATTSVDFAVDQRSGSVLFEREGRLVRAGLDGREAPLGRRRGHSGALAFDPDSRLLFRFAEAQGRIEALRTSAPFAWRPVLTGIPRLRSLRVGPDGRLYWINDAAAAVERLSADGSGREIVFRQPGAVVHAFALQGDRIFLSLEEAGGSRMVSASLSGGSPQTVFESSDRGELALRLAVDGQWLLWTNGRGVLFSCHVQRCVPERKELAFEVEWMAVVAKRDGSSSCAARNCTSFCLRRGGSLPVCACPNGIRLKADSVSCEAGPSAEAVWLGAEGLWRRSLDVPDALPERLPTPPIADGRAIALDRSSSLLYLVDSLRLGRADLEAGVESEAKAVRIFEASPPSALAVDPRSGNLYFAHLGRLLLFCPSTSSLRLLASQLSPPPVQLRVSGSLVLWSAWASDGLRLWTAALDGSGPRSALHRPNATEGSLFELHEGMHRLFWIEGPGLVSLPLERVLGSNEVEEEPRTDLIIDSSWTVQSMAAFQDGLVLSGVEAEHSLPILGLWSSASGNLTELPTSGVHEIRHMAVIDRSRAVADSPCRPSPCEGLCVPREESFECLCPSGQRLVDGKRCSEGGPSLLYSQRGSAEVFRRFVLGGQAENEVPLGLWSSEQPRHLATSADRLIWSDAGSIRSSGMDGSAPSVLLSRSIAGVTGLAVDADARLLFWTSASRGVVEVASLTDGSGRRVLVSKTSEPRELVLNAPQGYLYWAEWGGERLAIHRAEVDGSNRLSLLPTGRVYGLALDAVEERLYWSENGESGWALYSADLNGGSKRRLAFSDAYLGSLAVSEGQLFVAQLGRVSQISASLPELNLAFETDKDVLSLHSSGSSPPAPSGPCRKAKGGCSHLCFAVPRHDGPSGGLQVRCGCPHLWTLGFGEQSCHPPTEFLLLSDGHESRRWELPRQGHPDPKAWVPAPLDLAVESLAFNPSHGVFYWLEGGELWLADQSGGTAKASVPLDDCSPSALSLEAVTQQLFVACADAARLRVLRVKDARLVLPSSWLELVPDSRVRLLQAVSTPQGGRLLLLDGDRLSLCRLDSSHCLLLVQEASVKSARAAVYHPASASAYWTSDRGVERVSVQPYAKSDRPFFDIQSLEEKAEIADLATNGKRLFALLRGEDWSRVLATELRPNQPGRVLHSDWRPVLRVQDKGFGSLLVPSASETEAGLCEAAKCHSLCDVVSEDGRGKARCACPRGEELGEDGKHCKTGGWCRSWEWECATGRQCVHARSRCDGVRQCGDGSDEEGCGCVAGRTWPCGDGACVPSYAYCDGHNDCPGGQDELSCRCPGTYDCSWTWSGKERDSAALATRLCLHRSALCNRHHDCFNGSDEVDPLCFLPPSTLAPPTPLPGSSLELLFLLPIGVSLLFVLLACSLFAVLLYHKSGGGRRGPSPTASAPEIVPLTTSYITPTPHGTMSTNVEVRITSSFDQHSHRPLFTSTPVGGAAPPPPYSQLTTQPFHSLGRGFATLHRGERAGGSSASSAQSVGLFQPRPPPPSLASHTLPNRKRPRSRARRRPPGRGTKRRHYLVEPPEVYGKLLAQRDPDAPVPSTAALRPPPPSPATSSQHVPSGSVGRSSHRYANPPPSPAASSEQS